MIRKNEIKLNQLTSEDVLFSPPDGELAEEDSDEIVDFSKAVSGCTVWVFE